MKLIIEVFFGKIVKVGVITLGSPWEYFEKELSNADNTAISLRPFINTLNSNAVDKALAKTERYVQMVLFHLKFMLQNLFVKIQQRSISQT